MAEICGNRWDDDVCELPPHGPDEPQHAHYPDGSVVTWSRPTWLLGFAPEQPDEPCPHCGRTW